MHSWNDTGERNRRGLIDAAQNKACGNCGRWFSHPQFPQALLVLLPANTLQSAHMHFHGKDTTKARQTDKPGPARREVAVDAGRPCTCEVWRIGRRERRLGPFPPPADGISHKFLLLNLHRQTNPLYSKAAANRAGVALAISRLADSRTFPTTKE
jgi:hypothetical protein